MGSLGIGTGPYIVGKTFARVAGLDMIEVSYKGSAAAMTDLLGGNIGVFFDGLSSALPQYKAGKVRILAVASAKRNPAMPDVPTFAEQGVAGITVSAWNAISMPAGVAPGIVSRVATEFAKTLQAPEVRTRLTTLGAEIAGVTGEPVARMVREDVARWSKVVKSAGVKVE